MDEISEIQPVAEGICQASAGIAKEASRTGCAAVSDAGCAISDCLANPCFWCGVAAGVILLLLAFLIVWAVRRCRARMDAVVIRDEGGDFAITRKALKGFLQSIVTKVPGISLKCLALVRRKGKCDLDLCLTAADGANLVEAHKSLRTLVRDEVRTQLGLDECLGDVNFRFVSIPAAHEEAEDAPVDAPAQDGQADA